VAGTAVYLMGFSKNSIDARAGDLRIDEVNLMDKSGLVNR